MPFTTAYHTRFPEYVRARTALPLGVTYRFLRWFHGPAEAVMVPTAVVRRDLVATVSRPRRWCCGRAASTSTSSSPARPWNTTCAAPIFLYVGRVAVEKNIEAFLAWTCPAPSGWWATARRWPSCAPSIRRCASLGVLSQLELATLYAAADVFVFPSRTDTFGLVLLEAMACGCPVAAYPVTGPVDVIGNSPAGALDEDLRAACLRALEIPRAVARRHAERFSWEACTKQFLSHLHPFNIGPGEVAFAPPVDRGRATS